MSTCWRYQPLSASLSLSITDSNATGWHRQVRVRNLGRNSRWYSGSGIFRHVHLITTPTLHIGLWGVVTRTSVASDMSSATVSVSVLCENNGTTAVAKPGLTAVIVDATGKTVATGTADVPAIAAGGSATVNITGLVVKSPILWELDATHMYSVKVALASEKNAAPGATQDVEVVPFGIRTTSFTADGGFKLNGKMVYLQGGCVHHDNGPLGSATIGRAEERRVENREREIGGSGGSLEPLGLSLRTFIPFLWRDLSAFLPT